MRSSIFSEEFKIEPLLLHIKRRQLDGLGIWLEGLLGEACPTRRRPCSIRASFWRRRLQQKMDGCYSPVTFQNSLSFSSVLNFIASHFQDILKWWFDWLLTTAVCRSWISLTFKRSLGLAEVTERPASDGRLLDEFMSGTVRLCACRPLAAPLSLCSV